MATPAERYAAAPASQQASTAFPQLAAFTEPLDFALDDFQVQACRAVESGQGVLVAAPTGAGKTIVGELAVHLALATGPFMPSDLPPPREDHQLVGAQDQPDPLPD